MSNLNDNINEYYGLSLRLILRENLRRDFNNAAWAVWRFRFAAAIAIFAGTLLLPFFEDLSIPFLVWGVTTYIATRLIYPEVARIHCIRTGIDADEDLTSNLSSMIHEGALKIKPMGPVEAEVRFVLVMIVGPVFAVLVAAH